MNSAAQPEPHGTSTAGGWPIGSTPETNTTEVTTGSGPAHEWQSRLGSSRLARRVGAVSDVRARRIAALLLLVAFALVIVAQWKPWFSLNALGLDFGNSTRELRTIGAIDALYTLAIPYYLGWTVIARAARALLSQPVRWPARRSWCWPPGMTAALAYFASSHPPTGPYAAAAPRASTSPSRRSWWRRSR
jgi:hypothetical protein